MKTQEEYAREIDEIVRRDVAGGVAVAPGRPVPAWPGRGCEWQ